MKRTGKLFGIPYDWNTPTPGRIAGRLWNPQDRRILPPKSFGWGFTVNFYEVARRLHIVPTDPPEGGS